MMHALLLAALAIPLVGSAHAGASAQLDAARASSVGGAAAASPEASAAYAGTAFEGGRGAPAGAVAGSEGGGRRTNIYAAPDIAHAGPIAPPAPQLPASSKSKLPPWAMYAAGGGLGFLQGALFGGLLGGLAGAAIGLAATHFYMKDQPAVSIGISAGSIIGTFLGGPIGGLIGAVVGGLLGHFIGKLF